MQAVRLNAEDGPDALEVVEIDEPASNPDDVIIDVEAAGVSFVDLLMSRGQYQLRPAVPFVPGIEVAGIVRSAPTGCAVQMGDRVAASLACGGWAEVAVAPARSTFRLPKGLDFRDGTALAVNYQTAHFALVRRGHIQAGQAVLVLGASGAVGTACIQVAKACGAEVTAVVRSDRNYPVAREAGADQVVVASEDWASRARESSPSGFAIVVDPVGGGMFDDALRLLRPEGRLLVVGFAAGSIPTVKTNRVLLRNVDVVGVGWGAFLDVDPGIVATAGDDLARMTAEGFIRPVIGAAYFLEQAEQALRDLENHSTSAKVVLDVRSEA